MSWTNKYLLYNPKPHTEKTLTGLVSDFQRFSIHDGPGIRTIVFLKGCPLHCAWCANPETISARPEIVLIPSNCIGCGKCFDICPKSCFGERAERVSTVNRDTCLLPACGKCQHVCYANAINISGRYLTVEEVLEIVHQDDEFYERTGGGVTFSGGEPFAQPDFLRELACAAKISNLHTAIETCGHTSWNTISSVIDYLDYILFDLKHMDPQRHLQGTGVTNHLILENLKHIDATGKPIRIRLPLIPGFNDTEENTRATVEFICNFANLQALDILPYHRMGEPKWGQLDLEYQLQGITPSVQEHIGKLADIASSYGITVTVGG
jgi:pyruvate formate lyase activating enzyme